MRPIRGRLSQALGPAQAAAAIGIAISGRQPAAIAGELADLVIGSAQRKDSRVRWMGTGLAMAKDLSTKQRKKLSKGEFALLGTRKYPIPDKAHARNALA